MHHPPPPTFRFPSPVYLIPVAAIDFAALTSRWFFFFSSKVRRLEAELHGRSLTLKPVVKRYGTTRC